MATEQIHQYPAASTIDNTADYLLIDPASTGSYNKINRSVLLGITGSPVGTSDSQVLTNKTLGVTNTVTLKDSLFTLQDDGDLTKQAQFQLSGITTGNTRTVTLPDASLTMVGTATTQTLTNKTLTSPAITGGTYDNGAITVDSISGHTSSGVVTVGGVQFSSGVVNTSGAITSTSIAAGAVVPNALVASTGSGWAWTSFTPSWTNLTVGANGVNLGWYTQIGKTVFVKFRFILGNASSVGSNPYFTLPVTPNANEYGSGNTPLTIIGFGQTQSASNFYPLYMQINTGNSSSSCSLVYLVQASAKTSGVTATAPNSYTTSDYLQGHMEYEAA